MSANLSAAANGTQPPSCVTPDNLTTENVGKTFAYCLILVVSLFGNTLIGIIVYKTKTMRRTINYFIVNMAMSDLLFPIFVFPSVLTDLHGGFVFFGYQLGQAFCSAVRLLQYVSAFVSVESLVLIALDRFGAVVFPLRSPLIRSKLCLLFSLGTWVVAIALSFPAFYAYKPVEYTGEVKCFWFWKESFLRDTYSFAIPFAFASISFIMIVIFYSIVIFKLKSQKIPGEQSNNAEEQRVKRHRKVVKMGVAILTGFALCWGPVNVFTILNVFVWDNTTRLSCGISTYWYVALFIAHTNCALNPCICFPFNGNYRQGLKGLLGCHGTLQR